MNVPNSPAVELTREPVQGPSVPTRGHRPSEFVGTVDDGGHWGRARSLLRRHAVIIQSLALESVATQAVRIGPPGHWDDGDALDRCSACVRLRLE